MYFGCFSDISSGGRDVEITSCDVVYLIYGASYTLLVSGALCIRDFE